MQQVLLLFFYPGEDKRLGQALQFDLLAKKNARARCEVSFRLASSLLVIMSHFASCSVVDSLDKGGGWRAVFCPFGPPLV